jgi:diguanylate cyclase (GGDEF)-like protein/PAS domain S-box-containing protein
MSDETVVPAPGGTDSALQDGASLKDAVFAATIDPIIVLGAVRDDAGSIVDFEYLDANPAACAYNGLARDDLVGRRMLDLFPGLADTQLEVNRRVVETGEALAIDAQTYANEIFDGDQRYYDIRAVKLGDGLLYTWRDVTERQVLARQMAASEEHFRLLAENAADIVLVVKGGVIAWISPSVVGDFRSTPDQWIGLPAHAVVREEDLPALRELVEAVMRGDERSVRARGIGPNGVEHWVDAHARPFVEADGRITGLIATCRVIDDVMETEADLDRRARFDVLTGLLNREEILRHVTQVAGHKPRRGTETAVLFCDIDFFKDINDAYGHAAGDEVLRTVGARVAGTIRADDFAARIGGDEFLILLLGVHSIDDATDVAEKIKDVASQRVDVARGVGICPQFSIGVTLLRAGETSDDLIGRADSAMYMAKKAGRNRIVAV